MSFKKEIQNDIQQLADLKSLTETYQEIAAIRMQKIKNSVLTNRDFLERLHAIFLQVRTSYVKEQDKKKASRFSFKLSSPNQVSVIAEKNKAVAVLLSANTMLYGDIVKRTFEAFTEEIKNNDMDIVIVGRAGLRFFKEQNLSLPFEYFDFSDSGVDDSALKGIIDYIKVYSVIKVFHGKFQTILNQKVEQSYVRGTIDVSDFPDNGVNYLFEPSLKEVLAFFEKELLASLFEQTVFESNLSKFASRMVSLDSAVDSIGQELKKAEFKRQQGEHRTLNRKQLSSLSGISLW
ncbi:MAG: F0F1 ATP synthase subunit gamma [Patescibacteria group bacterium]